MSVKRSGDDSLLVSRSGARCASQPPLDGDEEGDKEVTTTDAQRSPEGTPGEDPARSGAASGAERSVFVRAVFMPVKKPFSKLGLGGLLLDGHIRHSY